MAPTPAFAEPTITVTGLSNAGSLLDGQEVDFTGEAVGDIINGEGGKKWLTLVDADSSISVYVSAPDAQKVVNLGRYKQTGTTLEISGIFHLACSQHEGLTDVHATSVTVLDPGGSQEQSVSVLQLQLGGVLVVIGVLLLVLFHYLKERTR
jgi:hypothetical protein